MRICLAALAAVAVSIFGITLPRYDHPAPASCPDSVVAAWHTYQQSHPEFLGRGPGEDRCLGA